MTDRKLIEADRRGGELTGESRKQLNNDGASDTVICCLLLQFYLSNQSENSCSVFYSMAYVPEYEKCILYSKMC